MPETFNSTEETTLTVPASAGKFPERFLGGVVLALMFIASAAFTLAYLSFAPLGTNPSQAATVVLPNDPFTSLSFEAQAVYVKDLSTGVVLFSKNADAQLPLASLTKVALILAILPVVEEETILTVPVHAPPDGAPKRLPDGSLWHAKELIHFTLVSSSNEGAEILAELSGPYLRRMYRDAPGGSAALARMNALARELGLTHSYFLNATGLDLSPTEAGAYGSAADMATLFAYAASTSPSTFEGTTRDGFVFHSIDGARATVINTDTILSDIPGLILGKTGSTDLAGGNLAIVFDVGPAHPIVAVVLHSTDTGRFDDMQKLVAATQASIAH